MITLHITGYLMILIGVLMALGASAPKTTKGAAALAFLALAITLWGVALVRAD